MNSPNDSQEKTTGPAPVLALGFRPFFLAAAAFGAIAMAWWSWLLASGSSSFELPLTSAMWHAHEMVFGYLLAVIAGFLLTAVGNWTGKKMPTGAGLLGLVALWSAGRVAMAFYGALPSWLVASLVVASPLALLAVVGQRVIAAGSRRNYGVLVILSLFSVLALAAQLGIAGVGRWGFWPPLLGALHLAVVLNLVIGGRIIPLFTRNRTKTPTRSVPWLDRLSLASAALTGALVVVATSVAASPALSYTLAGVAMVAALLNAARMRTWGVGPGLRVPMLAVLHVAYIGLVLGYFALALSTVLPIVNSVTSLHLFTVAGMGLMTVGMVTRVTLGHTGRVIEDDVAVRAVYVLMSLAAVIRLFDYAGQPLVTQLSQVVSGLLFAASLLVACVWAWPRLTAPRPDGKPG